MSQISRSYWIVETKDKKEDPFYKVGPDFDAFGDARHFATNCLRNRRQKYHQIVRCDIIRGIPLHIDLKTL